MSNVACKSARAANYTLYIINYTLSIDLLTLQRYDISIAVHECFGNFFSKICLIPSFSCFYIFAFYKSCHDVVNCQLSKSFSACQKPPLYNKYYIFIYSEQNDKSDFDFDK